MPTTIKLKNSVTTTNTPTSLAQGEVAINITDKKVWVGNAATTPIQLLGAGGSASFGALTCTSLTNSGLTSGRVTYASTGGLLADSANFTFNGTTVTMANDASISGLTVGKGGGAVSTNTAVGFNAVGSNSTGTGLTGVGTAALQQNTSGYSNTAVGAYDVPNSRIAPLYSNTTGNSNTGIGVSALGSNTTGSFNTAVGVQSLIFNTTASYNTAVGYQSLYTNTTGTGTALGAFALKSNTTGTNNTALGGYDNSSGVYGALQSNTTGSYNVGVGTGALQANTTASNNTAVGYQAGYTNATGAGSTYLGYQAGYSNTANFITAVGQSALYSNTGAGNTAFGRVAGYGVTSGTYNTILGHQAGYSLTTGSFNTFVGAQNSVGEGCGGSMTTGSKNTILGGFSGNAGGLDIRTASNYIVLSDGDGNPRIVVNTSGYTKISNDGTYISAGGSYHEMNQSNNNTALIVTSTNASQTNTVLEIRAARNTTNNTFYAIDYYNTGASAYKFRVADSGNVTNTNGTYGTISDIKNKENIIDATPKLDKIKQLQVRNFNFKNDELKQIGFIAQEFEQIFPSMVEEHKDTDEEGNDLGTTTKSIKTSVLVPILVKAVQELTAKVEALEAQLNK